MNNIMRPLCGLVLTNISAKDGGNCSVKEYMNT